MKTAASEALPTVVMEDDIALHENFSAVVVALLKDGMFDERAAIQLGYFRRSAGDALAPRSIAYCVRVSRGSRDIAEPFRPVAKGCSSDDDTSFRVFSIGRTSESRPFGTQSYIVTPRHARLVWESRRSRDSFVDETYGLVFDSEHLIFSGPNAPRPYRIDPPLAIEDFPRFGSGLGHAQNAKSYNNHLKRIEISEYYNPKRA